MGVPEVVRIANSFYKFGGATTDFIARNGTVPKHIAEAFTQLVANFRDAVIGRAAMRTGVAAVFDQGDRCIDRAKYMVFGRIDRSIKPGAQRDFTDIFWVASNAGSTCGEFAEVSELARMAGSYLTIFR
jgi:hypothetical protein